MAGNDEPVKGPWLQWPTPRSVTVMWETADEVAGQVEWFQTEAVHSGLSGGARTRRETRREAREAAPARIHRVELTGLMPDALCHYRVVRPDGGGDLHALQSAPPSERPFSFCVTSETGGFGDDGLNRRLFAELERWRPDFLLVVGDAVAHGSRYEDWERFFFGPGRKLLPTTPFLPVSRQPRGERRVALPLHGLPGAGQHPVHRPRLDATAGARGRGAASDARAGPVCAAAGVPAVYERSHPLRAGRLDEERGIVYIVAGGA